MSISQKQVLSALGRVLDPDFKKDLVTLKMIENVKIKENNIQFDLVLTTPACPMKAHLENECRRVLTEDFGKDIDIEIHTTSRTIAKRPQANLLSGVKNVIAIASGKGGVGKSTVAVNLALALAAKGAKVGLLDADIYGPSIPIMLGVATARPRVTKVGDAHKIIPVEKYGVHVLSIGFLVDEKQAVIWRGPMASSAIRQFLSETLWGELDYLLIDLPPGTGDIHLSIVSLAKPSGAVIVTTPQHVALADVRKAAAMFNNDNIKIPVLGVVENMSFFIPPESPKKKYFIFGKNGGKNIAEELDVPLLGQLPIHPTICEAGDDGKPIVLEKATTQAQSFFQVTDALVRQIAVQPTVAQ